MDGGTIIFGIIDTRYTADGIAGILRGKSTNIQNAMTKSRKIFDSLNRYENIEICPFSLKIVKLIGRINLGDSVEHSQITGFPELKGK